MKPSEIEESETLLANGKGKELLRAQKVVTEKLLEIAALEKQRDLIPNPWFLEINLYFSDVVPRETVDTFLVACSPV